MKVQHAKASAVFMLVFAFSTGAANAAAHSNRHVAQNAWQATRVDASQKPAGPCFGIPGRRALINASGEYVPSVFDPGPGTD
jgi:hypothetical protein